jgi:TonB family C-terminal domain
MSTTAANFRIEGQRESAVDAVLALLGGAAFTFGLFWAIAHFERNKDAEPPTEIADLRAMAVPMEPPPPRILEQQEPVEAAVLPFAGIEIGASESPVKIAVVPPDLEALLPHVDVPPAAAIQPLQMHTELKPKMDFEVDFSRVFQAAEVDQRPTVLSRPNPMIPRHMRRNAQMLRVSLLIVIDGKGGVTSIRVLKPSGNEDFDKLIVDSVRNEWVFTPAVKQGRKVRCLLQQSVTVTWRHDGTPFST